jgi:hypothetical protein
LFSPINWVSLGTIAVVIEVLQRSSQRGFCLALEMSKDVSHIDTARDEARTILFHRSQKALSAIIYRRHIAQIYDVRAAA